MKPLYQTPGGAALIGALFIGILAVCVKNCGKPATQATTTPKTDPKQLARIDSMIAAVKARPYETIEYDIKHFDPDGYGDSAPGVISAAEDLDKYRGIVKAALADTAYSKKAKAWKTLLIQTQIKQYPVLRKKWVGYVKDAMWKNDIEVGVSGKASTVITFTGGTFAANQNKADAQAAINNALHTLRFKQARYKWYSGDEEYTYYTMNSPGDSDF